MLISSYVLATLVGSAQLPNLEVPNRLSPILVQSETRQYIRGPRGGCHYINSNGNRTCVDRQLCRNR